VWAALLCPNTAHEFCHDDVNVIAYLDDVCLRGPADGVSGAYVHLLGSAGNVGLHLQATKCTEFSSTSTSAHSIGKGHGLTENTEGIVAAGCPVGKPSFVEEESGKSAIATKVVALAEKLMSLDLLMQDPLLLLRKSLQLKLSHVARCSEFQDRRSALLKVGRAIMAAILRVIGRHE
jgi:hypothetical protein